MELKELTRAQLKSLYETEMKRAFPPQELKPLESMERMRAQGRYQPLGLWEGEALLSYALMWLDPERPFVLLDYLGTAEGKRNRGLGGRTLELLAERYAGCRGIFGEAEAPENGPPEGEPLRRRRLAFYQRSGFRYAGYDCALFGVHYRTLIRGREDVTAAELTEAHRRIYQAHMPPNIYDRFIQIPLAPGEAVRAASRWEEPEECPE
ncbi:MAG: N-acetyltransferase [Lawsonibacter sp.]|nr:N-acetyltransferase [Lawsonibacter sp.]